MDEPQRQHWHLRKEFHASTLVFLALQTAGLIWWASKLDERVNQTVKQVATLEQKDNANIQLLERVGRIEENLGHVRERVKVIDYKIDKIRE